MRPELCSCYHGPNACDDDPHNVVSIARLPTVTSKVLQDFLTEQMPDPLDPEHPDATDQAVDFTCQDVASHLPSCVSEQLLTPDQVSNGAHQLSHQLSHQLAHQLSQAHRKEHSRAYNKEAQRRRRSKKQVRCIQGKAVRFEFTQTARV